MSKKVLITSRSFGKISNEPLDILTGAGFEVTMKGKDFDQAEFEAMIPDYDALIIGAHEFPEAVMERCPKLKIICKHGAGLDNIHLEKAKELGIAVCNVPGTNSNAVADLTFGLMLAVARNIVSTNRWVHEGRWQTAIGVDVCGKTLGLMGFGAIAKNVARRANGFGMKVLAYDPYVKELPEEFRSYVTLCSENEVISGCDFLSLHLPLNDETRNMISAPQLASMKAGAYVINAARGDLIREADLAEALQNGAIAGAGLDVFQTEPPSPDDPLFQLPNVTVTPHNAALTLETTDRMGLHAAMGIDEVLSGRQPSWPVVVPKEPRT